MKKTREAITDAGHRVSWGLVTVGALAVAAVGLAVLTLVVMLCRLS